MGLSGRVAARDVVAELAPDDLLDGHRDQRCYEVERVAVVGVYRGDERAAAAAPTADVTGCRTTAHPAGGRGG